MKQHPMGTCTQEMKRWRRDFLHACEKSRLWSVTSSHVLPLHECSFSLTSLMARQTSFAPWMRSSEWRGRVDEELDAEDGAAEVS